jgi:hypothetical protein
MLSKALIRLGRWKCMIVHAWSDKSWRTLRTSVPVSPKYNTNIQIHNQLELVIWSGSVLLAAVLPAAHANLFWHTEYIPASCSCSCNSFSFLFFAVSISTAFYPIGLCEFHVSYSWPHSPTLFPLFSDLFFFFLLFFFEKKRGSRLSSVLL